LVDQIKRRFEEKKRESETESASTHYDFKYHYNSKTLKKIKLDTSIDDGVQEKFFQNFRVYCEMFWA
jgi:hypothetical protein